MGKKTPPIYILSIRKRLQIERHTQIGRKGVEKEEHGEEAGAAILPSDSIDFRAKAIIMDTDGHDSNEGMSETRGQNPCKHECPQHGTPKIYKANLDKHKGRDGQ